MNAENISSFHSEEILGERLVSLLALPEHHSRNTRICLSGMPGSGKTTMARLLAGRLNGIYLEEFLEPLPQYVLDTRGNSPIEQQISAQRWILSQYKAKAELTRQFSKEVFVVQDRGVIDSLVYSAVYKPGVLGVVRADCEVFEWPSVFNIILIANDENVRNRMISREQFKEDFFIPSWEKYVQELRNKYIQVSKELKAPVLNTSNKTTDEVLNELLSIL